MGNLTFETRLVRVHPAEPLEGHNVVVFKLVGDSGERFHTVLPPGTAMKKGLLERLRPQGRFVAVAVDASPELHLGVSQHVVLEDEEAHRFDLLLDLHYSVGDPRQLASLRNRDPLGMIAERARQAIGRDVSQLQWTEIAFAFAPTAQELVRQRMPELKTLAATYGIALRSVEVARLLSEDATLRLQEIEADVDRISREERVRTARTETERRLRDGGAETDAAAQDVRDAARVRAARMDACSEALGHVTSNVNTHGKFAQVFGNGSNPAAKLPALLAAKGRGAQQVQAILSADAPKEIRLGGIGLIDFRIEHAGPLAQPFLERFEATISRAERIVVILTTFGRAIESVEPRLLEVEPPTTEHPVQNVFVVKAVERGSAEVGLIFRQGGSELGSFRFEVSVLDAQVTGERSRARVPAAPRDSEDDPLLVLLIDQIPAMTAEGRATVRYRYRLHSEELGLNYLSLESNPLLDRTGNIAADTLAYVERIYERLTVEINGHVESSLLLHRIRAQGADICAQLFDPELTKRLWNLRGSIGAIQITSWEPYIPWEMLLLRHPDTGEEDDQFLCEYGLVRALPGEGTARSFALNDWGYLASSYQHKIDEDVGTEVDFFTSLLPTSGIAPERLPSDWEGFMEALASDRFDVVHLACHGEARHDSIEDSVLLIGDEVGPGGRVKDVVVELADVSRRVRMKRRKPLVFLNACESGRHGPSLTAWGGWPNTFLKAGAGAFVGTSWPVRDVPAKRFAEAFYTALLRGDSLAEAATAGRAATKNLGDGSWLAFKVYGHPRARKAQPS